MLRDLPAEPEATLRRESGAATVAAAWVIVLISSALPTVVSQEAFDQTVSPERRALLAASALGVALVATFGARRLRELRPLIALLLVLVGMQWLVYNRVDELGNYPLWLSHGSFNVYMLAEQTLNLMVAAAVVASLLLMGKGRKAIYLDVGQLSAPVAPIRWLGIGPGQVWSRFGPWLRVCITGGTLVFLAFAGQFGMDKVEAVLAFLPAVLVAAFFGIGHFYGVPYRVVGVVLAAFLGWILARSMIETRGMFWAWFIHFCQDVLIFSFLAVGSVTPGG